MPRHKRQSTHIGTWLLIAIAIAGGAWIYARCSKSRPDINIASLSSQDTDSLIYTILPKDTPSQIKEYEGFTVNFNKSNHTANYVGWELTAQHIDGNISRSNNFRQDPEIDGCPDLPDYKRSGYDRGHLYPAADAKWSEQSMYDCFSLANIAPQCHSLNSGAWKTLEEKERLWARRDGRLIIVAGPVYTPSDTRRIGRTGVRVPSGFFKVMLAPDIDSPRAIGFVYLNDLAPGNMQNYSMTVDEVETLTGLDFFSSLPDSIETPLENKASFKEWNRR